MIGRRTHIGLSLFTVMVFAGLAFSTDDGVTRWLASIAALMLIFQTLALVFRPSWIRRDL